MFFFRYLYSDDKSLITLSNAKAILYVAEKYQVLHLKRLCENLHDLDVDESNPLERLDFAVISRQKELYEECLLSVCKEGAELREMLTCNNILRDTLEMNADCEYIGLSEINLFRLCNDWAVRECADKGYPATKENKREVLGPVFFKIRLPTLSPTEFAKYVVPTGYLTKEEEILVMRYQSGVRRKTHPFNCEPRLGLRISYDDSKTVLVIELFRPKWKLLGLVVKSAGNLNVIFRSGTQVLYGEYCVSFGTNKNYFPTGNLVVKAHKAELVLMKKSQAANQKCTPTWTVVDPDFGPEMVVDVDMDPNIPVTAVIVAVSKATL